MAVVIVPKFTKKQIREMLEEKRRKIRNAILLNLRKIGEQFVKQCRENDTYKDQTGNLRSSIGYVIIYNGELLTQNFRSAGGKEGVSKAKEVIEEVAGNFPRGFVLIGVAGMEYAAAVEARGYDVISAGSIQAETNLKIALQRISSKTK